MAEDELFAGAMMVVAVFVVTFRQVVPLVQLRRLITPAWIRLGVAAAFVVAVLLIHTTLATMSSWDVQSSTVYTGFYDVMGLAWLGGVMLGMQWLGLSLRDDVLERSNPAALIAFGGVLVGHGLAFAGGNIGDGPGWWCVVAASGLGSGALFAAWVALHFGAQVPDAITVERDVATAIRVAGLMVACGLVCGRAAAGTWISFEETVASFASVALSAAGIVAVALGLELVLRPSRSIPGRLPVSVGLALGYLAAAAYAVHLEGPVV